MKKIVSLLLALAMLLSLAACGGDNKPTGGNDKPQGGNTSTTEPNTDTSQTEFTIMGGQSALSPGYADNEVLNKLAADAGISIEWNTMSDSLGEQVNIRIAGGDLPDAFIGVGFSNYDLAEKGADGTFIDLTPYITPETMPNLSKIIEENPKIKAAITQADGKIYGLPSGEQMGTAGIGAEKDYSIFTIPQFAMINKAWLDDLGLAVPTSLDELHDALAAFKANDMAAKMYGAPKGSTLPMSTGFDQWCWGQNIFYSGFGFTNWPNDVANDLVLDGQGNVKFMCVEDCYRDCMTYFHDWYAEGLMDIEMFSQDTTQLMSKCQQGWVGVSTWWYIEELMGDYSKDYVFLPPLTGPKGTPYEGQCNVTVRTGGATVSGQLTVTEACQSPATLLKYFDQWYDGEVVMQLQYGPIGVYFTEKNEDGVWKSITEDEAQAKYNKGAGELKGYYEVWGPKLILSKYYKENFLMEDRAIERLTDLYDFWMPYVKDDAVFPVDCVYTQEELNTIDRFKPDYESTVSEQEGLWIKEGGPTDAEWEAYKQNLKDTCGLDELLAVYQGAYARYSAAE